MNLITFREECIDFTSLLIEVMTQNGKIKVTSSLPLLVRMREQRRAFIHLPSNNKKWAKTKQQFFEILNNKAIQDSDTS